MRDKPIITVKEARKILGKDAKSMNDEEVAEVINTLELLAKHAVKQFKGQHWESNTATIKP